MLLSSINIMLTKVAWVLGPKPCFTTFYSPEMTQSVFSDYNKPKTEKKKRLLNVFGNEKMHL